MSARRFRLCRRFAADLRAGRGAPGSVMSPRSSRRQQREAILVPKDQPIRSLADLRGKKVAFGKGSSAHYLLVAALEKAGLPNRPISRRRSWRRPTRRRRSQGFGRCLVDLGSVSRLAELKNHAARDRLRQGRPQTQRSISRRGLRGKVPGAGCPARTRVFASEGDWADQHHEEVAKAQAEATGVDIEAVRRFVDRSNLSASCRSTTR